MATTLPSHAKNSGSYPSMSHTDCTGSLTGISTCCKRIPICIVTSVKVTQTYPKMKIGQIFPFVELRHKIGHKRRCRRIKSNDIKHPTIKRSQPGRVGKRAPRDLNWVSS
ncbi:hypothetical protein THIOM_001440 [Candidatus Thiomargarita nelsonii]|uniref:Uncharacterized protein n=1 Tax=Candidatus Thiomargarita nelsonii TaxID=1003181 RepID=A0A176S4B4_9GAMM|nr:hypothetical protein THIOM_001440 [Candidatus Thiomargarita nelsonii]